MATYKDWENEIKKLSDKDIRAKINALNKLIEWPFFKEAYNGYGLPSVRDILRYELDLRKRKEV